MYNKNVVHVNNGIKFMLYKAGYCVVCVNVDEPEGNCAKWNKPKQKAYIVWFHLYVESIKFKLIEIE